MNIYRFIPSKSVREHLKKINYTFSSLETAYIIWQCPNATLTERLDAWQEIIDTMPDAPLPDRMTQNGIESVHEFLRQYLKLQQELLDEFNKQEDGVYFYKFTIATCLSENAEMPWYYCTEENFEHVSFSLSECKKEIQGHIYWANKVGNKVTTEIIVRRESVTSHSRVKAFLNERLEILTFDPDFTNNSWRPWKSVERQENRRLLMMSSFERMYFYIHIPVPFETGDIVYAEISYPDLISRRKHQMVVFDSISEDKKTTGRKCFIYAVDNNSPTGNFFRDEIRNYLALEYYRGKMLGLERFLKAVSNFMKGKLDLEKLIQTWIITSFEHKTYKESKASAVNRVKIEYHSEDDTAELTGLKN